MNEADTCRILVRPKLEAAGWDGDKHSYSEQTPFTDGRIIVPGGRPKRLKKKFSDFLLRYTRDITLAVVEANSVTGASRPRTTPRSWGSGST
jgi:type I restriction enzyme R subunit